MSWWDLNDLAASMGLMGQIDHPRVVEAIDHVTAVTLNAGLKLGIFGVFPRFRETVHREGIHTAGRGSRHGHARPGCPVSPDGPQGLATGSSRHFHRDTKRDHHEVSESTREPRSRGLAMVLVLWTVPSPCF